MKYTDFSDGFVLRLEQEEEVHQALTEFAKQKRLPSAYYHAIGALKEITLGSFNLEKKGYDSHSLSGCYELLSLMGNLSISDGEPSPHTHVVLVNGKHQVVGGHLFSAKVAVTVELFLFPLDIALLRKTNQALNFKELNLPHTFPQSTFIKAYLYGVAVF